MRSVDQEITDTHRLKSSGEGKAGSSSRVVRISALSWELIAAAALVVGLGVFLGESPDEAGINLPDRIELRGHGGPVQTVSFTSDGRALLTSAWDKTVRFWSAAQGPERAGKMLASIPHAAHVYDAAESPNGKLLATVGLGRLTLWSNQDDRLVPMTETRESGHRTLVFSPDGATLALGSIDGTVRLWDVAAGRIRAELRGHSEEIRCLAFAPDGRTLASVSFDGELRIWDPMTGRALKVQPDLGGLVQTVVFSPDGTTLAVGMAGTTAQDVVVLDFRTGRLRARCQGHAFGIHALAFSHDGRTLASSGGDKALRLWDPATGRCRSVLVEGVGFGRALAFSNDDAWLAFNGEGNKVVLQRVSPMAVRS